MLVYRVENSEGFGPYSGNAYETVKGLQLHNNNAIITHPGPRKDGLGEKYVDWDNRHHSGFNSKNKLHKWFDGLQKDLRLSGYSIAIYKVDNNLVKIGRRQILFIRDDAILVRKIRLGMKRR